MKRICMGNGFLLLCSLFYLAWWVLAFKPESKAGELETRVLLLAAAVCGIAALTLTIMGIRTLPIKRNVISTGAILWGGILTYCILFVLTFWLLKRQVTTELFLIVGWAVLELCMINGLYGAGRLQAGSAVVLCVVLLVASVLSLVCYVAYYKLEGMASYIDGMIPLILVALVMIVMEIRCVDIS